MDTLAKLQEWYASNCDGDWEHSNGIEVGTLDNPGWSVSIDLEETTLEERPFEEVKLERSEQDWCSCRKEGTQFKGWGGPRNLDEILTTFLSWAQAQR